MPKPISLWLTTNTPNTEDYETIKRFKIFAIEDKNYVRALKRLLDKANVS